MTRGRKIVVAMSGGVDSSLTAALLKEEGHDVAGITLRVHDPGHCQEGLEKTCCSARDIRDARRMAAELDIPFSSWDIRSTFEREVITPFVDEYRAGRTPNPCVLCNSRIKFRLLLEKTKELGAEVLATGHYARVEKRAGEYALKKGRDSAKDQSYFLFEIGAGVLPHVLFPLGDMTKEEVRRRAKSMGLAVAAKKESQEVCFVPGNDYGAFLEERISTGAIGPGPLVDSGGRRLGTHRGLVHYTVGQRRGLGVAVGEPLYVIRIDSAQNAIVVGSEGELRRRSFSLREVCWYGEREERPLRAAVRIRYRHREAPALITPGGTGSWQVTFDEPQRAVTPGQAAVLYDGERVLGGGWIDKVETD